MRVTWSGWAPIACKSEHPRHHRVSLSRVGRLHRASWTSYQTLGCCSAAWVKMESNWQVLTGRSVSHMSAPCFYSSLTIRLFQYAQTSGQRQTGRTEAEVIKAGNNDIEFQMFCLIWRIWFIASTPHYLKTAVCSGCCTRSCHCTPQFTAVIFCIQEFSFYFFFFGWNFFKR